MAQAGGSMTNARQIMPSLRRTTRSGVALLIGAAVWWPCLHLFYRPDLDEYRTTTGVAPKARQLAARHLALWTNPTLRDRELAKMQRLNPEWDFMSRTFFVLSLANMALRDPDLEPEALEIMDAILEHTLALENENGQFHFLLSYGSRNGSWVVRPPRSIFLDGEIALMLAARRLVAEHEGYRKPLHERVDEMVRRMEQSPVLCAESYPDECWLFCNTVALAAIRLADVLDNTDHSEFLERWVATARTKLADRRTGLLIAAFAVDGRPAPCGWGPEGTSTWLACHMLQVVDAKFAADQYHRARQRLGGTLLGFGYSREWPRELAGRTDIDSGPVVPIVGASASASGLAIIGAAAFDDRDYMTALLGSLNCAGLPSEHDGQLCYMASNPVGDSVMLYALVLGPLWDRAVAAAALPAWNNRPGTPETVAQEFH